MTSSGNFYILPYFQELTDYVKTYDQDLSSTCETQHFLVQNDGSPIKYVSNAYIERYVTSCSNCYSILQITLIYFKRYILLLTAKTSLLN